MQKAKLEQILSTLPDEVDVDSFVERLFLLRKIEIAEKQLAQQQGVSHENAKKRLSEWLKYCRHPPRCQITGYQ